MAKIRSSEAALLPPLTITEQQFASLEEKVGRVFTPELREQIEAVCNSYRDHRELQRAAAAPKEVIAALERLSARLRGACQGVSAQLVSDDLGTREAANLVDAEIYRRQAHDAEVEPLSDFSRRLRSMGDAVSEVLSRCREQQRGRRGPDSDVALNHLIERLAAIAKTAGIPVTAAYSQAAGGRTGRFVDLVNEVYKFCHGRERKNSGLNERIARGITRRKNRSR